MSDGTAEGLIDIHSHVLPGVDDGSRDVAESLQLLRGLHAAGFSHVFCTPHHGWGKHRNTPSNVRGRVAKLQAAVDETGLDVTLHAGGEHAIFDDLSDQRPRDWSTPNGYFLLDFWQPRRPRFIEPAVRRLQSFGLKPIFAHPERYEWIQADPAAAARWFATLGVELQVNVYTLAGRHPDAEPVARQWLDEGRYAYAATDTHRVDGLPLRLRGIDKLRQHVGAETFHRLLHVHPSRLLPTPLQA